MDDLDCLGTEKKLIECEYDSGTDDCNHSEDAGVACYNQSNYYLVVTFVIFKLVAFIRHLIYSFLFFPLSLSLFLLIRSVHTR